MARTTLARAGGARVSRVGDFLRRAVRRHAGALPDAARNPDCERFEVDAWQISDFVVTHLVPRVGVRPFPLHELLLMTAAAVRLRPSLVLEWGTHVGRSALIFREALSAFGISSHVHSVDLPADVTHGEHPGTRRGEMVRGIPGITLHEGDGLDVSLRIWTEQGRPPRSLFFLDGDHSRESVAREISGISAAAPDSALLVHDTFFQSAAAGYNVGPAAAVQDAVARHPGRWEVLHSGLGLPGMTLLFPRTTLPDAVGRTDGPAPASGPGR